LFGFYQKKVTKPNFFYKKNPKPNRNPVKPTGFGSVRFFRAKTGLARFSRFWLGFSGLARFFSVWFFGFLLIKLKPNRTGRFFQILIGLIGFFFGSVFSVICFSV
jgi:hypothetical protein